MGQVFIDPFIKVFDLRMMQMLHPISFPLGAFSLKFHPKFSSTVIIVSQSGAFQLCDAQGTLGVVQNYHVCFSLAPL
jgi:PAB-dependent poly(A)-specific ribonuclease subunit 2